MKESDLWDLTPEEYDKVVRISVNHHDQLVETLNDLLNDCINFDGGKLTDCYMEQASELLKTIKGESNE